MKKAIPKKGKQPVVLTPRFAWTPAHVEPRRNIRSRVAYRVQTGNGTLVLCDRHLEKLRSTIKGTTLTGETFAVNLCDHCHPEAS